MTIGLAPESRDAAPAAAGRRDRLVLLSVLLALFLAALEQTIVAPAFAAIGAALGDVHLLPWVATGYLLAVTASSPILAATADIVGRRPTIFLSLGLFLAGSTAAALSADMIVLIAARVVQGAGAGGLIALPFVVVADKVPMSRRAVYSAYISTMYAVATLAGPIGGGFMAQYLDWSAIFWINLPIGGVVLVALFLYLSDDAPRAAGRRIDFAGAALLVVAATATVLAFEVHHHDLGALPLSAAELAGIAVVAWLAFAWRMLRARSPLVPVRVMTERTILLCAVGLLCAQGSNIGLALYLPLYYQSQLGLSASEAGLATLGMLGGVTLGAYLPARLLAINPRYRTLSIAASGTAFLAGLVLIAVFALVPTLPTVLLATAALGSGIGVLYPVLTVATQNAAERDRMGAAIGLLGFMRAMGGSIGVATVGIIAVAIGLTDAVTAAAGAGRIDPWPLAAVPAVLMLICVAAMIALPDRELRDAAPAAPPATGEAR